MVAKCFKDSNIAVKYDTGRKSYIKCHQKGCECTALDLEIAEKLGGMKHHFVSTEDIGQSSTYGIEPCHKNHDRGLLFGEVASALGWFDDSKKTCLLPSRPMCEPKEHTVLQPCFLDINRLHR